MVKKSAIASALLLPVCAASLVAGPPPAKTAKTAPAKEMVTFNRDVAPIVYKNCAVCHRAGEIAPMSLMTYKEARPWGKAIREKVAERVMPPWYADPKISHFDNDRRLSQKDIDTIMAWVDGGLREGDPADLPAAPKYADGWNIGQPDVVFSLPEEYSVPAQGVVAYQNFTVPTNFTEDRWIKAAEVRPGNRSLVHHVIVYVQEPDGSVRPQSGLQILPIGAGTSAPAPPRPANAPPTTPNRNRGPLGWVLVGTAPGSGGLVYPLERGKLVKAGSKLVFQMHYTPTGTAGTDRTKVGLIFAKQAPEFEVRTVGVLNPRFVIPAGEGSYLVESAAVFTEDARIWSLFPHMHLRGKSFDYRLIYPDGRFEQILSVPKYDFNWQTGYNFVEPIKVTKGTRLECTAYFDNSTQNRFNPDATKDVRWGDQTWEEMMIGWIDYSVDGQRVRRTASAQTPTATTETRRNER